MMLEKGKKLVKEQKNQIFVCIYVYYSKELLHEEEPAEDFLSPFDAEEEEVEEEELEVYRPKGTTDDTYSIDEDEDTDSGVNIHFND